MDLLELLTLPTRPLKHMCRVPRDLASVTDYGVEADRADIDVAPEAIERIWRAAEGLYRSGIHPALQLCIRRRGMVVLNRSLGHARGNEPGAPRDAHKVVASVETPFCIYSASKAVTAMVIHKLDDRGVLHIDDRLCDYLPEFRDGEKANVTISHVLNHRAGIPNVPPEAMDLDILGRPEEISDILTRTKLLWRPGRRLAYHAISGGFLLGEVVRRVTGQDIRTVLRKEIVDPLGFRWMNYGVDAADLDHVARDAVTGFPPIPPFAQLFQRALGVPFEDAVRLASDPRFLTGIVPAGNVVTNAQELCAFYQCLLNEGELDGVRVFEPRTVHRATQEQSYLELDLTLGVPLRYGLGFMLGARTLSMFGPDTVHAFGHLGFTNIFSWADPERDLAVALTTSGKPFLSAESLRLFWLILQIGRTFPKIRKFRH